MQEGPTNLRYVKGISDTLTGYNPRKEGSGNICLTYGRMDLLGDFTNLSSVIAGVSPGGLFATSVISTNLSQAAILGDKPFPWPLGVPIGPNIPGTLFNSPTIPFEYFGGLPLTASEQSIMPLSSHFDLRQEGNDPLLSTPVGQPDLNREQVCFYMMNYTVLLPVVSK